MHAGALRALEFDRIVTRRGRPCRHAHRPGPAGGAALRPSMPRDVIAAQRATTEGTRFLADHPGFPLRAPSDLDAILDALGVEGRALEAAAAAGLGRLSRVDRAVAAGDHEGSAPRFRSCSAAGRRGRVVQAARSPTSAARSSRRARSPTTRAPRSPRFASACAGRSSACGRRSTRSCAAARPRSICRSRSSPIATAATC